MCNALITSILCTHKILEVDARGWQVVRSRTNGLHTRCMTGKASEVVMQALW